MDQVTELRYLNIGDIFVVDHELSPKIIQEIRAHLIRGITYIVVNRHARTFTKPATATTPAHEIMDTHMGVAPLDMDDVNELRIPESTVLMASFTNYFGDFATVPVQQLNHRTVRNEYVILGSKK